VTRHPFQGHTRVVVLDSIASPDLEPTVSELMIGFDVTCELTADGLVIDKPTITVDRSRWTSPLQAEAPARWASRIELRGARALAGETELLWDDAAEFGGRRWLVVRRGVSTAVAWQVGQTVEVYAGRWGKRATAPSARNAAVTFTVPFLVDVENDEATVQAGGSGS